MLIVSQACSFISHRSNSSQATSGKGASVSALHRTIACPSSPPLPCAQAACEILSIKSTLDPAGATYITFPGLNHCCRVSDWAHGFSPIRPDWLTRPTPASFLGSHQQGNRTCYQWSSHHHGNPLMIADNWSQDEEGVPCSYKDQFSWWATPWQGHNLTFDASTYSTAPEADDLFAIPTGMDCSQKCPNQHTWCFFTTIA